MSAETVRKSSSRKDVAAPRQVGKRKASRAPMENSGEKRHKPRTSTNKSVVVTKPQANGVGENASSAKRRAERKAERRDLLTRAKEKWEVLRPKATAKDKSIKLSEELYTDLRGRFREFAFRPDSSRIIQWLLTSSTPATRDAILAELLYDTHSSNQKKSGVDDTSIERSRSGANSSFFANMLTDRYAKHLAVKLLNIVPASKRMEILDTQVIPNIASLVRTVPGANALDVAYTTLLNGPSRIQLVLAILLSKQSLHWEQVEKAVKDSTAESAKTFKTGNMLHKALSTIPDEFRNFVMESTSEVASQLVEKEELLSLELVHAVLREWFEFSVSEGQVENVRVISSALASHVSRLSHTRPGMFVALTVIKVLDAKHRKKAVRSLSGVLRKVVLDEFGHRVVIGVMEWTDDTRLVGQLIVGDLFKGGAKPEPAVRDAGDDGEAERDDRPASGHERKRGGRSKAEKKGKTPAKVDQEDGGDSAAGSDNLFDLAFLGDMCLHKHGRMILLNVLFGRDSRYFNPEGYGIVWEAMEEERFGKTSKKEEHVRRQELLSHLSGGIQATVKGHFAKLLQSVLASPVVVGASLHDETRHAVVEAMIELFQLNEVRNVCAVASARRGLGAVFKVSPAVAKKIIEASGPDVVRILTSIDGGFSVAKHLAHASENEDAMTHLKLFEENSLKTRGDID